MYCLLHSIHILPMKPSLKSLPPCHWWWWVTSTVIWAWSKMSTHSKCWRSEMERTDRLSLSICSIHCCGSSSHLPMYNHLHFGLRSQQSCNLTNVNLVSYAWRWSTQHFWSSSYCHKAHSESSLFYLLLLPVAPFLITGVVLVKTAPPLSMQHRLTT